MSFAGANDIFNPEYHILRLSKGLLLGGVYCGHPKDTYPAVLLKSYVNGHKSRWCSACVEAIPPLDLLAVTEL